ncbi:MAG: beta-galactosidase [Candidatus Hydrogenedentota bacterium]
MKKTDILVIHLFLMFASSCLLAVGWENKGYFTLKNIDGREIFSDPDGSTFYSIGMVYAYGPENPELKIKLTPEKVINDLEIIKEHSFNTLNLYGDLFLDSILPWCDKNKMAVYFRTKYAEENFPDFLDPAFFDKVKKYYDEFYKKINNHHCVLAIDMDQRWMLADADWSGTLHGSKLKIGDKTLSYLPNWLKDKYNSIDVLNKIWNKNYLDFNDVLKDEEIIKAEAIGLKPYRLDLVLFSNWSINSFLQKLTTYMKFLNPNYLITYTTELPEVFLFPLSTKQNSGIDFISPVHYNSDAHFNRDWIAAAKLIFQSKFHYDLQNLTVYISETGFRTDPLSQTPPAMMYASSKLRDKEHQAEMYLREMTLLNALPFISGWGYFKFYDKWFEGDFGYINDDVSLKPISKTGKILNKKLPINLKQEKEPIVWIYYPQYAFSSNYASSKQYQTLVLLLENEYLKKYETIINNLLRSLDSPSDENIKKPLNELVSDFDRLWLPFKFTDTIPNDDKPIILAGRSLEVISLSDREKLKNKKTITLGEIGKQDEGYNKTDDWYLEILGINTKELKDKYQTHPLPFDYSFSNNEIICNSCNTHFIISKTADDNLCYLKCMKQKIDIADDYYTKIHFLIASSSSDYCEKISLLYQDRTIEQRYFAPTIPSYLEKPNFGHLGLVEKVNYQTVYITHLDISCNIMKKLDAIILPDNEEIYLFAVSFNNSGKVNNSYVEINFGDDRIKGSSPWVFLLDNITEKNYNILARFGNGYPAVIQTNDARHTAFLYDALTWDSKNDEISREIESQSNILLQLIK